MTSLGSPTCPVASLNPSKKACRSWLARNSASAARRAIAVRVGRATSRIKGQILVRPGTRVSVIHVHDRYEAVSLYHRNIDKRSRAGTLQRRGGHGGSLVLSDIGYGDELTPLEAVDEGAIVAKLKDTRERRNAGCIPVSGNMESFGVRIDGRIAYPAHPKCAAENFGRPVTQYIRVSHCRDEVTKLQQ